MQRDMLQGMRTFSEDFLQRFILSTAHFGKGAFLNVVNFAGGNLSEVKLGSPPAKLPSAESLPAKFPPEILPIAQLSLAKLPKCAFDKIKI
jgi:hypothetical protein